MLATIVNMYNYEGVFLTYRLKILFSLSTDILQIKFIGLKISLTMKLYCEY